MSKLRYKDTEQPPQPLAFLSEARTLFVLALPIIATQLAQTAMGFVDTIMAGRYGDLDLAGIAIGTSIWIPVMLALTGILMAVTPLASQAFGARDRQQVRQIIQQALWLSLLLAAIVVLVLWQVRPVFDLMGVDQQVADISQDYLRAISWGVPAIAGYQVLRSANEALHRTQPIMYIGIIALLCNIPLNYIFIYGKLGMPALGGVGCGWATTAVFWLQFVLLAIYTCRSRNFADIRFWQDWQKPLKAFQAELLWIGVPIGFSIFIEASMFTLIALFLAPLGHEVVAAHQITISFTGMIFMIPLSLAMALTIRCGYTLGTGDARLAQFISRCGLKLGLISASCTAAFIYFFAEFIAGLYTPNPEIQQIAVSLLLLACIFQFSDALQVNAAGALRGYKDTRIPLLGILVAYWMIGLPLGYSLALTDFWGQQWGARGFWIGIIIGLTIGSILLIWRLFIINKRAIEHQLPLAEH